MATKVNKLARKIERKAAELGRKGWNIIQVSGEKIHAHDPAGNPWDFHMQRGRVYGRKGVKPQKGTTYIIARKDDNSLVGLVGAKNLDDAKKVGNYTLLKNGENPKLFTVLTHAAWKKRAAQLRGE